ncbi:pyrroline-5-carboxylate reductase [Silvimonas sp. JCM 19000]
MNIGFIGTGNMASAMIAGLHSSHPAWQIHGFNRSASKLSDLQTRYALQVAHSLPELVARADYLVLAVKPQGYDAMLDALAPLLQARHTLVTVAVGYTIARVQARIGTQTRVVRSMPNTPASVSAGMSALCGSAALPDQARSDVSAVFESFGRAVWIDEGQFDVFSAVAGSSPAWVYMMIEAMADAAVQNGMPRAQAYAVISQAVLGSAQLVRDSGQHPGVLKDQVCSPGGTTIAGVAALEKAGMRNAWFEAVNATLARTKALG